MCVVLPAYMFVHRGRPEKCVGSPGPGFTGARIVTWGTNPGPLRQQPVLLTTEPSPQPSNIFSKNLLIRTGEMAQWWLLTPCQILPVTLAPGNSMFSSCIHWCLHTCALTYTIHITVKASNVVPRLRALVVPVEDLGSFPSTHVVALTPSSGLFGHQTQSWYTDIHTSKTPIYIKVYKHIFILKKSPLERWLSG